MADDPQKAGVPLEGWPGEKLLMKVLKTGERAVVGACKPWQIKRESKARAEARREELLLLEQTEKDLEEIRYGRKAYDSDGNLISLQPMLSIEDKSKEVKDKSKLATIADEQRQLIKSMGDDYLSQQFQKSINLKKIILYAEEECEGVSDDDVSDDDIDQDWLNSWREKAQNVSSEQMQRLWARVLAGEAKQPNTFSIHTMDFLSRLSKQDAQLLAKLAQFSLMGNAMIFRPKGNIENFYDKYGLLLSELLYMQELNIISGIGLIGGVNRSIGNNAVNGFLGVIVGSNKGVLLKSDEKTELDIEAHPISRVGRELLSLAKVDTNIDYLKDVAISIKQKGFNAYWIDWIETTKGHGSYFNPEEITE